MPDRFVWLAAAAVLLSGCAALRSSDSAPQPLPARVVRISDEYANINTDLKGTHLRQAGVTVGSPFQARYNGELIQVTMGEGYGDVPRGDWVGLIEEDGTLQLAISYGHAADVLGCAVGDTLFILPAAQR